MRGSELRSDGQARRPILLDWFTVRERQKGSVLRHLSAVLISLVWVAGAYGQGNYEGQVYGSDLVS